MKGPVLRGRLGFSEWEFEFSEGKNSVFSQNNHFSPIEISFLFDFYLDIIPHMSMIIL